MALSLYRKPEGEPVGVSGLHWIIPKGAAAPGKVLPPAPPGTGNGELLSSVPMKGSTSVKSDPAEADAAVSSVSRNADRAGARIAESYTRALRSFVPVGSRRGVGAGGRPDDGRHHSLGGAQ